MIDTIEIFIFVSSVDAAEDVEITMIIFVYI
jgi:hypothetical protein